MINKKAKTKKVDRATLGPGPTTQQQRQQPRRSQNAEEGTARVGTSEEWKAGGGGETE